MPASKRIGSRLAGDGHVNFRVKRTGGNGLTITTIVPANYYKSRSRRGSSSYARVAAHNSISRSQMRRDRAC